MPSRALRVTLIAAFSIAALAFIFAKAMEWEIHQDEHQFIAPGALWAQRGLLPYKDFPLFHMPDLVFIYGALDKFFAYKALAARVLSALCQWLSVLLLARLAWNACANFSKSARLFVSLGLAFLFLTSAVFANVARLSWNHALPVLLVLCAFAAYVTIAPRERGRLLLLVSGFYIGVAIGSRLTFAPLLAPFGLAIFFFSKFSVREKWLGALMFSIGAIIALSPSLYFLAAYREQFLFGNFGYPKLSVVLRDYPFYKPDISKFVDPQHGFLDPLHLGKHGRPLAEKLRGFASEELKLDVAVFASFFLIGVPLCIAALMREGWQKRFDIFLLALVFPFILAGCIAPSRYHIQYYYALLPFLVLAVSYGLSFLDPARFLAKSSLGFLALCCAVAVPMNSFAAMRQIDSRQKWSPAFIPRQIAAGAHLLVTPSSWSPVRAHRVGVALQKTIGSGKVLTLAPTFPLEGGLEIYPQFVTGAFAWRSSHLIPADQRHRVGLISPYDLEAFLEADPPGAILLRNKDVELNQPFIRYAEAHRFSARDFAGGTLWLPPAEDRSAPQSP